jgi:hypothetical protein
MLLAAAILILIVAGGYEPFYLQILEADREALRMHYTELPYRRLPGLRIFMSDVARATAPGDRIGILIGDMSRWDAYPYGFTRSSYLLAGRQVVPLIGRDGHFIEGNLAHATHVACWHCRIGDGRAELILENSQGTLSRLR